MNIIMSNVNTGCIDPAEDYIYEARDVAMKELTKHLLELSDIVGYDAVCQSMIDAFGYHMPTTNNDRKDACLFLLCAVKECVIHKDSAFIGNGYLWEKVSKAMDRLDMPIKEA